MSKAEDMVYGDEDDPLSGHPRYVKLRHLNRRVVQAARPRALVHPKDLYYVHFSQFVGSPRSRLRWGEVQVAASDFELTRASIVSCSAALACLLVANNAEGGSTASHGFWNPPLARGPVGSRPTSSCCAVGSGASGSVHLAIDKETQEQVAIKFIERHGPTSQRIIARELLNHRECARHPHIIQLRVRIPSIHHY